MRHLKYALAALLLFSAGNAKADNYDIGVEGFWDNYREPGPETEVNNHAVYGSVIGTYEFSRNKSSFLDLDGRFSYGRDHYDSIDGSETEIPQYEGEFRVRYGLKAPVADGELRPYVGLGARLYYDDWSNHEGGYTRDIQQYYLPLGVTYKYPLGDGWQVAPTAEYDQLVYGHVFSGLKPYIGYNINNNQHDGYGLRGDFLVGQEQDGYGWKFGPFVRYWNIKNSAVDGGYIEPNNNRVQAGAELKLDY